MSLPRAFNPRVPNRQPWSTWLDLPLDCFLFHESKAAVFLLAQESGFPLKQLPRLLLVMPVRSQEHVDTASSYAGIIRDEMP